MPISLDASVARGQPLACSSHLQLDLHLYTQSATRLSVGGVRVDPDSIESERERERESHTGRHPQRGSRGRLGQLGARARAE
jgi:hypothetical protein